MDKYQVAKDFIAELDERDGTMWTEDDDAIAEAFLQFANKVNVDNSEVTTPSAMKHICEQLSKDKSEGSYYYTWQANIAVSFQDTFKNMGLELDNVTLHEVSNKAAKNFLDILIM